MKIWGTIKILSIIIVVNRLDIDIVYLFLGADKIRAAEMTIQVLEENIFINSEFNIDYQY